MSGLRVTQLHVCTLWNGMAAHAPTLAAGQGLARVCMITGHRRLQRATSYDEKQSSSITMVNVTCTAESMRYGVSQGMSMCSHRCSRLTWPHARGAYDAGHLVNVSTTCCTAPVQSWRSQSPPRDSTRETAAARPLTPQNGSRATIHHCLASYHSQSQAH